MTDQRLVELAARHGIDAGYHDIWGAWHPATERSLRALLDAMGVAARDADEVERSMADEERRRWAAPLPVAAVVRQADLGAGLRLQLADEASRGVAWRITEEQGRVRASDIDVRRLEVLETVRIEGRPWHALRLPLPLDLPLGYHRVELIEARKVIAGAPLIVVPQRCYQPQALADGGRLWGGTLQLYSLRSERNWGIGDFSDLRTCIGLWAARGASVLGVNPLHALFWHNPAHCSPYSPSSRLFVNPLYLDVDAMADAQQGGDASGIAIHGAEFRAQLQRLRDAALVDHVAVAAAKRPVLEALYASFSERELASHSERGRAFRAFCAAGGRDLHRYALFEALQEHLRAADPRIGGWQQWPQEYRDPDSVAVARFAEHHAPRIDFFRYLQWQSALQLQAAQASCAEAGMEIGLYTDLAVSVDRAGADAWSHQSEYALSASVGAPPDEFNRRGQDWGLPPLAPEGLAASGYAVFIAAVRAGMSYAGALRIDHVMGLARLYWVPPGMSPEEGGYVRYPFQALLGIIALESQRKRCLVIGEDLGTVPDELRHTLHEAGVLSYRVLLFERHGDGRFKSPQEFPHQALAAWSTHDLPTLAGFWQGQDLIERERLGLFPDQAVRDEALLQRTRERAALLLALEAQRRLPPGVGIDPAATPLMTPELALAVHAYIASTPAALALAQVEDVLLSAEQANLPGTVDEHPNWRRKLSLALEFWSVDPRFVQLTAEFESLRARSTARASAAPAPRRVRIPRATYRLQLHAGFGFRDAQNLLPYLAALGISHVYCSPILRARHGSKHGYDIIDHQSLNPELGSREDFDALTQALAQQDMGLLVDIVPNHMGVMGADNQWWLDVLENGLSAVHAQFFDIDWQPPTEDLHGRVLLPVLGDHYGAVLLRGELVLGFDADTGGFNIGYFEHRFPVDPRTYPQILNLALSSVASNALPEPALMEFKTLASAFGYLPARDEAVPERIDERSANKEVFKRQLAQSVRDHAVLGAAIQAALRWFNGRIEEPQSFDALDDLLEAQAYRLAHWRVAYDEINYRRFFEINDLAALRMEDEVVFETTHHLIFNLLRSGAIDALRIDHPDGLYDPAGYFRRLQELFRQVRGEGAAQTSLLYVAIEKIAEPFESLPEGWPVQGTTGYRFANLVNGLFVDSAAETRISHAYHSFIEDSTPFADIARRCKRMIVATAMASELTLLANGLLRVARADRMTRDYTLNTLRLTLAEVIAEFPVYRTYIAEQVAADDRRYVEWAVGSARRHSRAADLSIYDFVRAALLGELGGNHPQRDEMARRFARRFQQVTAPVMAKGMEDTAFYRYNRLISLNEVGGDPSGFGCSVAAFHRQMAHDAEQWPHTLLAGSTHDNKRAEDVRARIDVLSEMPGMWRVLLRRWSRLNRTRKRMIDGAAAPGRNDEYFLYQTLLGSFPPDATGAELDAYRERIEQHMLKAVREAKAASSWTNPDPEYEAAVTGFAHDILADTEHNLFLQDLRRAAAPIHWFGMLNSLSATLIRLTAPGVPDFYQGSELWDLSLVDPDNRRPVDYALRRTRLAGLQRAAEDGPAAAMLRRLFSQADDGDAKLFLIWRLLQLRREHERLFRDGSYEALQVVGTRSDHVIAYARRLDEQGIIVAAGRLFARLGIAPRTAPLGETWRGTRLVLPFLDDGTVLTHVLSGRRQTMGDGGIDMSEAFADAPVAVLMY